MIIMKKKIIALMSMATLLLMVGCGASPYEDYMAATEKTESLDQLAYQTVYNVKADVDTEGLSTKEKRNYSFLKNMRVEIQGKKDGPSGQIEQVIRYNLNGIGFDIIYYQDKESKVLKLPFFDKYILLEGEDLMMDETAYLMPSEETIQAWNDLWMSTVEADKVFRDEKDLVETPAGEVKATRYIVEIEGQALKSFAKQSIDILLADVDFVKSVEEEVNERLKEGDTFAFASILHEAKIELDAIELDDLVFESYVSIDGYIIKEVFKTAVSFEALDKRISTIDIQFDGIMFDINQDQDIDTPEFNEDNTADLKVFQESFPMTIDGFKK